MFLVPAHPAWNSVFARQAPLVKLLDVKLDESNLTTYTFSNCNFGDFGTTQSYSALAYGNQPWSRSPGRKAILFCVHGADALATFDVTDVTVGGVASLPQVVDRGGLTVLFNTAIFAGTTDVLSSITNTTVTVTWSEAVTACAIGILEVSNIAGSGVPSALLTASAFNASGTLALQATTPDRFLDRHSVAFIASTAAAGEQPNFNMGTTNGAGNFPFTHLYEGSGAEISYAAAWAVIPSHRCDGVAPYYACDLSWSGAGAADGVTVITEI